MQTDRHPHVEIIVPVCNNVKAVQPFLREMDAAIAKLADTATVSYLFVDDGSKDGSRELLHRLFRERAEMRVVDLIHSFGQTAALACGLAHFEGDVACLMDLELPNGGMAFVEMFAAWLQGAKTVVAEGRAFQRAGGSLSHRAFDRARQISLAGLPVARFTIPSLLDRTVADRLKQLTERGLYFPGLLSFASEDIATVRIDLSPTEDRRVTTRAARGLRAFLNVLLGFSAIPLSFASVLALFGALGFLGLGFSALFLYFLTGVQLLSEPFGRSLLVAGMGLELLALGLCGQYLARVFEEVKQRPLYWVDRVLERKNLPKKSVAS